MAIRRLPQTRRIGGQLDKDRVTFRLDPKLKQKLKKQAEAQGRTLARHCEYLALEALEG